MQARDTHSLANKIGVRVVLLGLLAVLVYRLFTLQVRQHTVYASLADANRLSAVEIPAPRGLIFDRNGVLLARNRSSYHLGIVPVDLPDNDADTEEVDEEFEAIMDILLVAGVHEQRDQILEIQRTMFRALGYRDYLSVLNKADIPVSLIEVPIDPEDTTEQETLVQEAVPETDTLVLPDIGRPLPIEGLARLIQEQVQLQRQGNASNPIPILFNVAPDVVFVISEQSYSLPGIQVLEGTVREYVYGELVSHILGFLGPIPEKRSQEYTAAGYMPDEQVGLSGIEASYQDNLRGKPGVRTVEVDIFGQERRTIGETQDPVPGQDILLTLDIDLQRAMYNALLATATEKEADSAAAIAIDPRNGQVLGLVSLPTFDNNIFAEGLGESYFRLLQDERRSLFNFAIAGLYPPGSTFKIVTSTAGMEEGVISNRSVIVDAGPIFLSNKFFPDDPTQAQEFVSWNHAKGFVHGPLTLREAIAVSNDIFFYFVGGGYPREFIGLEQKELAAWAKRYGYGEQSGIDLPGEVSFPVPDDHWKRTQWFSSWVTGDSYNMAIGQGYMLATPLQVLQSVIPVANGGTLYQPQLVLQITETTTGRIQDFTPYVNRVLDVDPLTLETIRLGMRDAVHSPMGTATQGAIEGIVVAGKTGTAEYCEYDPELQDCVRDEEGHLPTHASYVAFAPFNQPEIAVMVFVYNGGEGSEAAVPVATHILDTYFSLKGDALRSEDLN